MATWIHAAPETIEGTARRHMAAGHRAELCGVRIRLEGARPSPERTGAYEAALAAVPEALRAAIGQVIVADPAHVPDAQGTAYADHAIATVSIEDPVLVEGQGIATLANILTHEAAHLAGGRDGVPARIGRDAWRRARASDHARPGLVREGADPATGAVLRAGPVPAGDHRARDLRTGAGFMSDYVVSRAGRLDEWIARRRPDLCAPERARWMSQRVEGEDFAIAAGWWAQDRIARRVVRAPDGTPARMADIWPARTALIDDALA